MASRDEDSRATNLAQEKPQPLENPFVISDYKDDYSLSYIWNHFQSSRRNNSESNPSITINNNTSTNLGKSEPSFPSKISGPRNCPTTEAKKRGKAQSSSQTTPHSSKKRNRGNNGKNNKQKEIEPPLPNSYPKGIEMASSLKDEEKVAGKISSTKAKKRGKAGTSSGATPQSSQKRNRGNDDKKNKHKEPEPPLPNSHPKYIDTVSLLKELQKDVPQIGMSQQKTSSHNKPQKDEGMNKGKSVVKSKDDAITQSQAASSKGKNVDATVEKSSWDYPCAVVDGDYTLDHNGKLDEDEPGWM